MKIVPIALVVLAFGLTACSSSEPPPPKAAAAQLPKPLPNSNIFSSDINALNKAKAVQGVVDKQAKDADQQLKDDGG